jgi:hypothetical protein
MLIRYCVTRYICGYKEITDYVKIQWNSYNVADMLVLTEGTLDGVGLCGWGMIVVYENNLMKSRDITI